MENNTRPAEIGEERESINGETFLSRFTWLGRVIYSSCDRFYWDGGFSKAAALAYTTLFSLVPVTVFGFGILASLVLSNENLRQSVRAFIFKQFVPNAAGADEVLLYLDSFSTQVLGLLRFEDATLRVSVFALIFLVASSLILINTIEYTLNQVWQVFEPRSIAHRLSVLCTVIVLAPVLTVSAFYTNVFLGERMLQHSPLLNDAYGHFLPFLIDSAVFSVLYFLVPKAPVKFLSAVFGAFLAAILFDAAKLGFSVYVAHYSSYQRIYGTVSTIVIFLFWLYLSWSIILVGAEFSYQFQNLPRRGSLLRRYVMSVGGEARLLLAVQALVMVARAFERGTRLPNDLEIAEAIGCSSVVLRPVLAALKKADIITRNDSNDGAVCLARSPDVISLRDLRNALFRSPVPVQYSAELSGLFALLEPRREGEDHTLADVLAVEV